MTTPPHPAPGAPRVPAGPPARSHCLSDVSMDEAMGRLLQAGVMLASATVLTGGAIFLYVNGAARANYRTFRSEPAQLRQPLHLIHAIAHGDPAAIIQLGILLLIATPVARVAFAAVAFTLQRDRLYLGISLFVLAILLVGLFTLN